MKKIVFLLVMALIMACFVPALDVAVHPQCGITHEACLSSYCAAEGCSITLASVSAQRDEFFVLPAGFLVLSNEHGNFNNYAVNSTGKNRIKPLNTGQAMDRGLRLGRHHYQDTKFLMGPWQ